MSDIHKIFHVQSQENIDFAKSVALYGPGGIGKTQVAIAFCFESKKEGSYSAIFWASAVSRDTLLEDYRTIASQVFGQIPSMDREITASTVKDELQNSDKYESWLLVVDNADEESYEFVKSLIPLKSKRGTVLLTTRSAVIARTFRSAVEIDILSSQAAVTLLLRASLATSAPLEEIQIVAEELGCFPLALEQAAAYVRETESSFAEYLRVYLSQKRKQLDRQPAVQLVAVQYYTGTVYTALSVSVSSVETKFPGALQLLYLLSFFSPNDIPENLLKEGASGIGPEDELLQAVIKDPTEARKALLGFSLIRRLKSEQSLWMHVLLQEIIRDKLGDAKRDWAIKMSNVVAAAYPDNGEDVKNWTTCRRYLPHVFLSYEYSKLYEFRTVSAANLFSSTAFYLKEIGAHYLARPLCEYALEIRTDLLGPADLNTAQAMNDLGLIYWQLGLYKDAEKNFRQVLSIRRMQLGEEHYLTGWSMNCLGVLAMAQSKWKEAHDLLELTLIILRKALGPCHAKVGSTTHDMGQLALSRYNQEPPNPQRLALAARFFSDALEIRETALGRNHPETARSLYCLAKVHGRQGKTDLAISELLEAKRIFVDANPIHFEIGFICEELKSLYFSKSCLGEAQEYAYLTLEMYTVTSGPLTYTTNFHCFEFAWLSYRVGDLASSQAACRKVISSLTDEKFAEVNPVFDDAVLPSILLSEAHNVLGLSLSWTEEAAEAETAFLAALQLHKSKFPGTRAEASLAVSLNLLQLYSKQNNADCFPPEKFSALAQDIAETFRKTKAVLSSPFQRYCDIADQGLSRFPNLLNDNSLLHALQELYSHLKRETNERSETEHLTLKPLESMLRKYKHDPSFYSLSTRFFNLGF